MEMILRKIIYFVGKCAENPSKFLLRRRKNKYRLRVEKEKKMDVSVKKSQNITYIHHKEENLEQVSKTQMLNKKIYQNIFQKIIKQSLKMLKR